MTIIQRSPQWHLKTSRTLLSDEEIARARKACVDNEDAKKIKDKILENADYWMTKSEDELRQLLPGPEVPRAFNVSSKGCPIHGKEIYKHGTYPWILDKERPFVIKCPIGGEEYPDNDFARYHKSGMKDRSLLTGKYIDEGRGWVGPDGEKYWMVAYACHWNWSKHWIPAVQNLAQAYVLTGDGKYARQCIVMLDRIAEVYPGFDYNSQSRYGELSQNPYNGKILNYIWETRLFDNLVNSYDSVFDVLIGENPMELKHRNAREIRENIEANLIEEGIDCIKKGYIAGNWGMHQRALVTAILTRQNAPRDELLDWMFNNPALNDFIYNLGVNYTLYNLVSADGMPFETSPGYAFGWTSNMANIAYTLKPSGIDLFQNPKVKRLLDAPLDLVCIGKFTPAIGDAGAIDSGYIGLNVMTYQKAYDSLKDARYAWIITRLQGDKPLSDYNYYEDLFNEPDVKEIEEAGKNSKNAVQTRLLDDYGLGILNNKNDSAALSLFYGLSAGHGHSDCLNLEIFAYGRKIAPDLGYPDFMNAFVHGIASWSKNTISHNTALVNSRRQDTQNAFGKVAGFHTGDRAHIIDVEADNAYKETSIYRRTIIQLDLNEDDSCFIDIFRVSGGNAHDLSVHGAPGDFRAIGLDLSEPQTSGTLAGEDVPYGFLYDDPVRSKTDYKGELYGYSGSGYQHLFNVQRGGKGESGIMEWKLAGKDEVFLRVHILPEKEQEIIVADAYVSPTRKRPDIIKYVLAQRRGENLESCYVAVWEPFLKSALIKNISRLPVKINPEQNEDQLKNSANQIIALSISLRDGKEYIVCVSPFHETPYSAGDVINTDSKFAVLERDNKEYREVFSSAGNIMQVKNRQIKTSSFVKGEIVAVDYAKRILKVKCDKENINPENLLHKWIRIYNAQTSAMKKITSVKKTGGFIEIGIGQYDLLNALLLTGKIDAERGAIEIGNPLPWRNQLIGMRVLTEDRKPVSRIVSLGNNEIVVDEKDTIKGSLTDANKDGKTQIYLSKIGPGDAIEIE
ncbi:heparinase II/III family protein [Candidatus Sumerlaeota bacterium]|nr:heparinase II/III family protein [Candidatus Sumerlaeota bacterium]